MDSEEEDTQFASHEVGGATSVMMDMLREQHRAMLEQQRAQHELMRRLLAQQKEELLCYRAEVEELRRERRAAALAPPPKPKLPKPTLRKLVAEDDIEDFLSAFERIARQQAWPKEVWATQLAGLLTEKALSAYTALSQEDAGDYEAVKEAVLLRYEVNDEMRRLRYREDQEKTDESYGAWTDRMKDHFSRWTKAVDIPLEEVMLLEQFLQSVPAELGVWIRERKPRSVKEAAELADDYSLARKGIDMEMTERRGTIEFDQGCEEQPQLNQEGLCDGGRRLMTPLSEKTVL